MAAATEYLLANAEFKNTEKHAQSFAKLITNANFRSIFTWRKEEISNKRENFDYDFLQSFPEELRTFICRERARHVRYFAVEFATCAPRKKPIKYDGVKWMQKFRRMFTASTTEAHNKANYVSSCLGH